MPVTQLGTGKTQFLGHGASSQSKCSCQWISGPASSCHRPRLPRRNLKIVSSHPFFCISRNLQKFETSLKSEGAGCPKRHKFESKRLRGRCRSLHLLLPTAGAQILQLGTPPSSHWTTSRAQHRRTAAGPHVHVES